MPETAHLANTTPSQVHFPDHTKLVLSASGTLISATCISTEAAAYLDHNSDLLAHHISGRETYNDTVQNLLHGGSRIIARIVKANDLARKLGFVAEVVGQWIGNQGLGRLDFDVGGEKLYWEGMMVKDQARKTDRVTVGRLGGDEQAVTAAVAGTVRTRTAAA